MAYTYLRGVWKDDILIQGFGIPDDEIDLDGYSYWADVCDTNGWRLAGEISAGDDRAAVLTAICAHGGAVPVHRAGLESVNVSAPGVSVVTLTDDDWIGLPELGSATEKFTLANQIIPRFAWESARFDLTDAEPISPAAWLESDDNIERSTVFPLPWCTSLTQAGQIAAYAGYNDREPQQLLGTLKPSKRYSALPGDCFSWQSAELGVTIKFRLQAVTAINEDLSIAIQAVTETDAKHALALGTTALPPARQAMPPFDDRAVITIADNVAPQPDNRQALMRPLAPDNRSIALPGLPDWTVESVSDRVLTAYVARRPIAAGTFTAEGPNWPVKPGETISASIYVAKRGTWTTGDIEAAIRFFDVDGDPLPFAAVQDWADGEEVGTNQRMLSTTAIVAPSGAVSGSLCVGVFGASGSGSVEFWRGYVTGGAVLGDYNDRGTSDVLLTPEVGKNVLGPDGNLLPAVEVLNTFTTRIEGPASATIQADFRGTVLAGQLPRTLTVRLLRGTDDVSASASWGLTANGSTASVTGGAVTITDTAGSGSITVTATLDGVPYTQVIEVTKINAAPPVAGGGGATTAVDTTINSTSSTSLVTVGGPLTVRAGAVGQIVFNALLTFTTTSAFDTDAATRIRYRAVGSGSWLWADVEATSDFPARGGTEPARGSINGGAIVTGLTSGTDYECELLARSPSGATLFFEGSFTAEAT